MVASYAAKAIVLQTDKLKDQKSAERRLKEQHCIISFGK